jgi:hypothetical protein
MNLLSNFTVFLLLRMCTYTGESNLQVFLVDRWGDTLLYALNFGVKMKYLVKYAYECN